MKKAIIMIIAGALTTSLLLTGCEPFIIAADGIEGSGNQDTREYDFSDFTKIDIGNSFDFTITRSDTYRITITADDNVFEYIVVTKTGKTLKIGLKPFTQLVRTTVKADISMPQLHGLDASGATTGTVIGFSSDENFNLNVSGASSLTLENMSTGQVTADISGASKVEGKFTSGDTFLDVSGAGKVELEGSVAEMVIDASGASNIELKRFIMKDSDISLSGSSYIKGNLEAHNVSIDASGASKVVLEGSVNDITIKASGASQIDLYSVPARNASVHLSGASRAEINLKGRLDIDLSDMSELKYTGEPIMGDIEINSGASIERMN